MKHERQCPGGDCRCEQGSQSDAVSAKCATGCAGDSTGAGADADLGAGTQACAELERKLAEAEAKAAEHWDLYLRTRAEFENYQKRVQRDLAFNIRCGKSELVKGILPVIDDFERALCAESADSPFKQGVEMIMRKLLDVLARDGVKPIEAVGCPFDPRLHEAVATREQDGAADHTIVEELRRGYTYDDDVIRPTLVIVAVPNQ